MKNGLFLIILLVFVLAGVYLVKSKSGNSGQKTQPNQDVQSSITPAATQEGIEGTTVPVNQISLEISQPADKSTVSSTSLTVKGKTSANAEVFVNDKELKAGSDGSFAVSISLEEGENSIIVVANDSLGNYAEKELTVTLETL